MTAKYSPKTVSARVGLSAIVTSAQLPGLPVDSCRAECAVNVKSKHKKSSGGDTTWSSVPESAARQFNYLSMSTCLFIDLSIPSHRIALIRLDRQTLK